MTPQLFPADANVKASTMRLYDKLNINTFKGVQVSIANSLASKLLLATLDVSFICKYKQTRDVKQRVTRNKSKMLCKKQEIQNAEEPKANSESVNDIVAFA